MSSAKHRFFCTDPTTGFLDEEESGHALRVLRLGKGDQVELVDGKGGKYLALLTEPGKKQVFFQLLASEKQAKPDWFIHIAIAPTKNIDRLEFFLEKCTEIGLSCVTPVITKNSERKEIKAPKLQKTLVSALKQSGTLFLPELKPLVSFKDFIQGHADTSVQKFIAHCEDDQDKIQLFNQVTPPKNIVILIGPEGDFSHDEIVLAKKAGFKPVSLGESRLRTETAGIVACLTVHLKQFF
ncbi:MAG: 16S rRNA (uracil(1498)-N(3))-methyltransferase [Bacteroidetes bacterium]|nr:16S rRNA (uracil(1498)-N(3))-methyltransferase [Bacteroidota bacterium]